MGARVRVRIRPPRCVGRQRWAMGCRRAGRRTVAWPRPARAGRDAPRRRAGPSVTLHHRRDQAGRRGRRVRMLHQPSAATRAQPA
eukprot:scaffold86709_cov65-Phaeocystis_antarctica.AAC.1